MKVKVTVTMDLPTAKELNMSPSELSEYLVDYVYDGVNGMRGCYHPDEDIHQMSMLKIECRGVTMNCTEETPDE